MWFGHCELNHSGHQEKPEKCRESSIFILLFEEKVKSYVFFRNKSTPIMLNCFLTIVSLDNVPLTRILYFYKFITSEKK
jgi:hypothetical protein